MKHTNEFNRFLKEVVNINQTRIDILEQRVGTIQTTLKSSDLLTDNYVDGRTQGSWATETIIKPLPGKEFDADLRIHLNEFHDWAPKDYINNLYGLFKDNNTYKGMVSRKTRCVTLNYAGDFHLDIVPCLETDYGYWVFNRRDNVAEPTDADGYTNWFRSRDTIVGGKKLIKVVRLVKYLRDIKGTFTAKSVLLTTLLANQVNSVESEDDFRDLPTSLHTVSNRLNGYLQANPIMPIVRNPALPEEDFNRHWDQAKYENFRNKWSGYTAKINDALEETSRDESIKKWRLVFGDEFGELSDSKQMNIQVASHPTAPWVSIQ